MTNIILCGGSGTRLWPISRTLMPKQFVKLFDDKSLFQLTVERNSKLCDKLFVVSNNDQYFLALDQLEEHALFDSKNVEFLLEPIGRNTAPAIALACMALPKDEVVLVTPSDHLIRDEVEYAKAVQIAIKLANDTSLVTFGITPTFAETGFGYIESSGDFEVVAFYEKPDQLAATKYLESGNFYWNSGMFAFRAGLFLAELEKHAPKIYSACKEAFDSRKTTGSAIRISEEFMQKIPSDSIDYAVMEKSSLVKVVPSDIGWSDLGSYDALSEELPSDTNILNGIKPISIDSKNNLVISQKLVALVDIEDLVVVDSGDSVLICKKGSTQKVKEVVKELARTHPELTTTHPETHRPWGTYTVLEEGDGYKIKRIVVKPQARLSLQKHFHRSEHWIVVSGTATVTVGDEKRLVRPNESTYIKAGELHRLENEGKIPVVLIEAQVGEYTGEDDIVRVEDGYGRA